jgi:hypothetical protein
MQQHEFTAQNASDEVLRQAEKLDNLVPTLTAWRRLGVEAIAETMRTGKPLKGFTEESHVSVARGVHTHAAELRRALSVLEAYAEQIIETDQKRKKSILDRFLG